MSASNFLETSLLKLLFNGEAIPTIATNAQTDPATVVYLSLHTGDPGEGGKQNTSEADYESYQRVPVPRDGTGFEVNGNIASNVDIVTFPTCSGGSSVVTHVGIGLDPDGAGELLFSGELEFSMNISNGITPEFRNKNLTITCN